MARDYNDFLASRMVLFCGRFAQAKRNLDGLDAETGALL